MKAPAAYTLYGPTWNMRPPVRGKYRVRSRGDFSFGGGGSSDQKPRTTWTTSGGVAGHAGYRAELEEASTRAGLGPTKHPRSFEATRKRRTSSVDTCGCLLYPSSSSSAFRANACRGRASQPPGVRNTTETPGARNETPKRSTTGKNERRKEENTGGEEKK